MVCWCGFQKYIDNLSSLNKPWTEGITKFINRSLYSFPQRIMHKFFPVQVLISGSETEEKVE